MSATVGSPRWRISPSALLRFTGLIFVAAGAFEFAWSFTQGWSNASGQAAAYSDQSIWLAEAVGGYLVGIGLVLLAVGVVLAGFRRKS